MGSKLAAQRQAVPCGERAGSLALCAKPAEMGQESHMQLIALATEPQLLSMSQKELRDTAGNQRGGQR